jgi:threonine/homoserine/homoserine lactone efflux protein
MTSFGWTLPLAAATVGGLHTLAPDHWMPFAALARARGWTPVRALRTTIACGFGHVTVSAILGIAALSVGTGIAQLVGGKLASLAPALLMLFGTVYMLWGLRPHRHRHEKHGVTEGALFLLFSSDPCVALIPLIIAAASGGWALIVAVIVAYELGTITSMSLLVITAQAGARAIRAPFFDRYGDAVAGALILTVGAAVRVLGI